MNRKTSKIVWTVIVLVGVSGGLFSLTPSVKSFRENGRFGTASVTMDSLVIPGEKNKQTQTSSADQAKDDYVELIKLRMRTDAAFPTSDRAASVLMKLLLTGDGETWPPRQTTAGITEQDMRDLNPDDVQAEAGHSRQALVGQAIQTEPAPQQTAQTAAEALTNAAPE